MRQMCITQLAKMNIDPKFIELTADVFRLVLSNTQGSVKVSRAPCPGARLSEGQRNHEALFPIAKGFSWYGV